MINKRPRRRSFRRLGRTVCILNAGSPMCMKSVICMLLLLCTSLFTYIDAEAQVTNQVTGVVTDANTNATLPNRSEEHTSELQSRGHLVCRLLLEKKNRNDLL